MAEGNTITKSFGSPEDNARHFDPAPRELVGTVYSPWAVPAFPTVAALYVETGGCYFGLPGVDPWDIIRDARQYAGPHPVVAHPPCDRWHMLSAVNHKRWGFKINEDDGVFAAALDAVRTWGGVLEHPAQSRAFRFHGLPHPKSRGWQRTFDGDWITEVDQAAYGQRARKTTWLLYHGDAPPPMLNWRDTPGTHQVGNFDQKLPVMGNLEARLTPEPFRDLLLSIARSARAPAMPFVPDDAELSGDLPSFQSVCGCQPNADHAAFAGVFTPFHAAEVAKS